MKVRVITIAVLLLPWAAALYAADDPVAQKWPDRVNVKGQILEGRIMGLDAGGITFGTSFGRGTIQIDYADIFHISSNRIMRIYFGRDEVAQGFLTGILADTLTLKRRDGRVISIHLESIITGLPLADYEASDLKRLRTDFRHWKAGLNFGLRYEETTIDKIKIEFGLGLERRKKPTRLVISIDYAYEIQRSEGTEVTSKDELTTSLLGEYDLNGDWFVFARPAMDYDKTRYIDRRYYPAAGLGFRLYEDRNYLLQIPLGMAYVDEDFIGYGDNSYTALYFGFEGGYKFRNDATVNAFLLYMPGLSDPDEDGLMRLNADFKLPIVDPLALLVRLTFVNDNNPAPGVGDNKLTLLTGISLNF